MSSNNKLSEENPVNSTFQSDSNVDATSSSCTEQVTNSESSDNMSANDSQETADQPDVKELAFKRFLYMEASFRYQEPSPLSHISIQRSNPEKGVSFRELLVSICPDVVPNLTGKTFVVKRNDHSVSYDNTLVTEKFLDDSPFAFLFHANGDGTSTVYDESVNLSVEYKGEDKKCHFLTIVIKPLGSTESSVYARLSMMKPHEGADDLLTMRSDSLPLAASCVLVFDVLDPEKDLKRYESLEQTTIKKVNDHQQLEPLEDELMRGMSGINYPGYNMAFGKWLLDQGRFYDAYVTFERVYNCLKAELSHIDQEGQAAFYRACYAMGICMQKLGFLDKASYYLQLAINGGQEYIGSYVEVLAESSHNRVCLFLNQLRRQVAQNQSAAEELHRLEKVVTDAENNYKAPDHIDLGHLPLGYALRHIYDAEPRCLLGAVVLPTVESQGAPEVLSSSEEICNLNLYDLRDTLVYIRYSHAGWEMGNTADKSILCQNNCIVLNIHSVTSAEGKNYIRVNTMSPNFSMNDEKRIPGPFNLPRGASFVVGEEGLAQQYDNDHLDEVFKFAVEARDSSRILEAMRAFEYIHQVLKIEYTKVTASDEVEELFFEATHQLGACLLDLALYERATYYLDWSQEGYKADYAREYVNCLCYNNDIRALNVIENLLVNLKQPSEPEYQESYQYFQSFLKRRKVYALMNRGDVKETESLLHELLSDPLSKDYAEQELEYIQDMGKQKE